jgi:tetratricopeptide (TPR) repeat protein
MIRKLITFSVLALFVLVTASCQKLQARDNLNKGIKAFREARFEQAVEYFENASKLDPELTNAELYLATAWAQQYLPNVDTEDNNRFAQKAIEVFDRVLAKDPNNTSAVAGLAGMYQSLGNYPKAKEYYVKQTQIDPENPVPYYAIGSTNWMLVYNKQNPLPEEEKAPLVEEGLQYVDKALEKNPNYDDAMTYKNLLLRQKALLTKDLQAAKLLDQEADVWHNKALETRKANDEKKNSPTSLAEEQ